MAHTPTSELSTSIMSIDSVPPSADDMIVERTALLDVEQGVEYGSRTPLLGKGMCYQLSAFDICMPIYTGKNVSQAQTSIFTKRVKYYIPSLAWIPSYNSSLYVAFCRSGSYMLMPSLSKDLLATFWRESLWHPCSYPSLSVMLQLSRN